jgi:hypothetical protein
MALAERASPMVGIVCGPIEYAEPAGNSLTSWLLMIVPLVV